MKLTDYGALRQDPKEAARNAVRRLMRLYSEKVHFVYEFLQNADDAGWQDGTEKQVRLGIIFREHEGDLLVWNDGRPFTPNDIRGICSIGLTNKDLTHIGTFGIGFKAVYVYTDLPEVYSGDECFRIRDYLEPEALDKVPSDLQSLLKEGKTVFRLPFKESIREGDIERLRQKLGDLGLRSLLFLRHLTSVEWRYGEAKGVYSRKRSGFELIPGAHRVVVSTQVNGQDLNAEEWLVFSKSAAPPPEVIQDLLRDADDNEERDRIQNSAEKEQPLDVAFLLQDDRIVPANNCVLFAYLPTEKETHLHFLIQARYQTTPARDNVPTDNPWNGWLVKETADFLPDVLKQLKAAGLLTPSFFDVLPLDEDMVPEVFQPIVESLEKALREGKFIPIQSGGYARPDQVFHPHAEDLRKLLTDEDLAEGTGVEGAKWLHPDIRDSKEHRRRFAAVRAAGVREVDARKLVSWLATKGEDWLQHKDDKWLCALYAYLSRQKAEQARIKALPLVRLENGRQVCAAKESVFFPPKTDEERQELAPFLHELPIVKATLLEGEDSQEGKAFLEAMGVKPLSHAEVIRKCLLPKYQQSSKPSVQENHMHLRYLRGALNKVAAGSKPELLHEIQRTPLLLARKAADSQKLYYEYVQPSEAYLPQAYTGDPDLETYFAPSPEVWFVDDGYMKPDDEAKKWSKFLEELSCADLPRVRKLRINEDQDWSRFENECRKRGIERKYSTRCQRIEDQEIDGLPEALSEVINSKNESLSKAIWQLLVKLG